MIITVVEGGPSERVGLKGTRHRPSDANFTLGDIILSMDGEKIDTIDKLVDVILSHDVGDNVLVEYMRDEQVFSVEIALGQRP